MLINTLPFKSLGSERVLTEYFYSVTIRDVTVWKFHIMIIVVIIIVVIGIITILLKCAANVKKVFI